MLQRFDNQHFSIDLFHLEHMNVLMHFIGKKTLLPVTEITGESSHLIELLGQQVLIAITHIGSKKEKIRSESHRMLERLLPQLAPAVFKGMQVATVDFD